MDDYDPVEDLRNELWELRRRAVEEGEELPSGTLRLMRDLGFSWRDEED